MRLRNNESTCANETNQLGGEQCNPATAANSAAPAIVEQPSIVIEPAIGEDNVNEGELDELDFVPRVLPELRNAVGEKRHQTRAVAGANDDVGEEEGEESDGDAGEELEDANKGDVVEPEYDRGPIVDGPSLGKFFPIPESFDGLYISDDSESFGAISCFDRDALSDDVLILTERYSERRLVDESRAVRRDPNLVLAKSIRLWRCRHSRWSWSNRSCSAR